MELSALQGMARDRGEIKKAQEKSSSSGIGLKRTRDPEGTKREYRKRGCIGAGTATSRATAPRNAEITAAARVFRQNPQWATLDCREDYVSLSRTVSRHRRSTAVRLMVGIVLHGFYHRAAVECMPAALRLPSDRGLSSMEWVAAMQGVYEDMLKLGRAYRGPQGFPYRWIKNGTDIAESLRPHLSMLYGACVSISVCSRPSLCAIGSLLPPILGWYSMSSTGRCMYMRRHLARWMTCYLYPQGHPNAADWELCLNGMGSGTPRAAALLGINTYGRALVFRKVFAKASGRAYSLYDLSCFLCLSVAALRREVDIVRRRAVCKGIHRRGDRYLVQVYDGTRSRYIGSRGSVSAAKRLYARTVKLGMTGDCSMTAKGK